jgi:hypothetical protein
MNTILKASSLTRILGGTRSLVVAVAVAAVAFGAFVATGETSVQASQSKDATVVAQPDTAMVESRIAAAFAGAKLQPVAQPACAAKRVRVVYSGYGEAARPGCSQAAGL